MNCKEVKNLLLETCNLNEITANKQLQAHIAQCSKCRTALKLEQKLREGFDSIAKQGPPAHIATRILSLSKAEQTPAKITCWWQSIVGSLAQIPLKTIAISCLAGFMIAMFVFRQDEPVISQHNSAQTADKTIREIATEVVTPPTTEPEVAKIETQAKADMIIALNDDTGIIPGAESSFLIHNEANSLISNNPNEENMLMSYNKAIAPSMLTSKAFKSESSPQILFSKITDTNSGVKKKPADPRVSKLEKLLNEAGIPLKPGYLDLSLLAMQGLISSEKLIPFRPAPGSHWFVVEYAGNLKIILKNNK